MFRFLFIIFCITNAMTFAQPAPSNVSQDLNTFIVAFDAAWNTHNSKALSSLWMEDGDLITPWGRWIMSRDQIAKHLEQDQAGPFGKATIQQSIDAARFLTPNLVLVDATIKLDGSVNAKEEGRKLLQHGVYLLMKVDNQWKIVSARVYHFQAQLTN